MNINITLNQNKTAAVEIVTDFKIVEGEKNETQINVTFPQAYADYQKYVYMRNANWEYTSKFFESTALSQSFKLSEEACVPGTLYLVFFAATGQEENEVKSAWEPVPLEITATNINYTAVALANPDLLAQFVRLSTRVLETEEARELAEDERVSAEEARINAENERALSERTRRNDEQTRLAAETARAAAEQTRLAAETARAAAEQSRATAENARQIAEESRGESEHSRELAECERETASSEAVSNANAAAASARGAAEAANYAATRCGYITAETDDDGYIYIVYHNMESGIEIVMTDDGYIEVIYGE